MTMLPTRRRRIRGARLQSLYLRNFKSARLATIPLGQLTLLVGENSSGKSSILQALQLIRQAAVEGTPGEDFPLNGNVIRVGEISDLRTAGTRHSDPVSIGVSLRVPLGRWSSHLITHDEDTEAEEARDNADLADSLGVEWSVDLVGTASDEPGSSTIRSLSLSVADGADRTLACAELSHRVRKRASASMPSLDLLEKGDRLQLITEGGYRTAYGAHVDLGFSGTVSSAIGRPSRIAGALVSGGFPNGYVVNRKLGPTFARAWVEQVVDPSPWRRFEVTHDSGVGTGAISSEQEFAETGVDQLRRLIDAPLADLPDMRHVPRLDRVLQESMSNPRSVSRVANAIADLLKDESKVPVRLDSRETEFLTNTSQALREMFRFGVKYLGPLRTEPQVVMSTSATARTGDIGPRGEYTAAVLRALGHRRIRNPTVDSGVQQVTLLEGVTYWARHLGLVESVTPDDLGAVGLTMSVRPTGIQKELPLPSVGVGVSQLLPVLVLCLSADRDDVLLLEQPELHLHPAIQQRLADFLLAIAASGRQLIIETHSEYLVSRLRRRIAEDQKDNVLDLVNIVFAERHQGSGDTSYRQIRPSSLGGFDEWPVGFFDQAATEELAILRAASLRRSET